MEQDKNNEPVQQPVKTSSEQGRVEGTSQQTSPPENKDISQVDQQEGHMENGELGGNFEALKTTDGGK